MTSYEQDVWNILSELVKNEKKINIFSYENYVKHTICSIKNKMDLYNISNEERKSDLENLSQILHDFLHGKYEESLNDKSNWDPYFKKLWSEIPVLEIDKKSSEGETVEETSQT